MKLVFPQGEHPQVLLGTGISRIGAAPDGAVVLTTPSMPRVAAEIHVAGNKTNLIPRPGAEAFVNDKQISELIALRVGDRLKIAGIEMRLAPFASVQGSAGPRAPVGGDQATRIAAAVVVPKYVLRGLNGSCFGKIYPVTGPLVIGRAPECDIALSMPEISRRHAQLQPVADGVSVEDLGSSNGIWINNRAVSKGILRPGDELRLDVIRFTLSAPGMEFTAAPRPTAQPAAPKARAWTLAVVTAVGLIITAAVIAQSL